MISPIKFCYNLKICLRIILVIDLISTIRRKCSALNEWNYIRGRNIYLYSIPRVFHESGYIQDILLSLNQCSKDVHSRGCFINIKTVNWHDFWTFMWNSMKISENQYRPGSNTHTWWCRRAELRKSYILFILSITLYIKFSKSQKFLPGHTSHYHIMTLWILRIFNL